MPVLPWYNQLQIDYLEGNKNTIRNYHIFEYGLGYSTIYYSQFAKSLSGVETRESWYNLVLKNTENLPNVNLTLVSCNFADSIETLFFQKNFNKMFIIIDSNERAKCLQKCTAFALQNKNTKQIVIMLDNSERENLQTAITQAQNLGFFTKHFSSIRPNDGLVSHSTLFCLNEKFFV